MNGENITEILELVRRIEEKLEDVSKKVDALYKDAGLEITGIAVETDPEKK
jgi:hypothetical protein